MRTIEASVFTAPPAWALGQRQLLDSMSNAALAASRTYSYADGTPSFLDDVDDVYESRAGRALLYALGGRAELLQTARREWDAVARCFADVAEGPQRSPFPQLHNEYYNLGQAFEWFHQGEGNQALYELGVADGADELQQRRAIRFADMFTGDDPEAPNYDRQRQLLRSPFPSSVGPLHHAGDGWGLGDATDFARMLLARTRAGTRRASLAPAIADLEDDWFADAARRDEVIATFDRLILDGDTPTNLTATALVTHAFLHTGHERYRRWVLDYSDAWLDRIRANGGLVPDNVGPTGRIGEHRGGQWWGGLYGWNSNYAADINFGGLTVAAECAQLLTGDSGYLELLRSQLTYLLERARHDVDGQLLVPGRYDGEQWTDFRPARLLEFAHLYHASLSDDDRSLIEQLRAGDVQRDWNAVRPAGDRRAQESEYARFQFYNGANPGWPESILQAEQLYVQVMLRQIQAETRDLEALSLASPWPPNPVVTKGLVQVTTGAPQTVYNGGLLRSTVRHFDAEQRRPGLPADVAAFVNQLGPDSVGWRLVNLSTETSATVLCQAGAFGEHEFGQITYDVGDLAQLQDNPHLWLRDGDARSTAAIDAAGPHVLVSLGPGMSVHLRAGLQRFARVPSYTPPCYP
jgi:hypothetical protein